MMCLDRVTKGPSPLFFLGWGEVLYSLSIVGLFCLTNWKNRAGTGCGRPHA